MSNDVAAKPPSTESPRLSDELPAQDNDPESIILAAEPTSERALPATEPLSERSPASKPPRSRSSIRIPMDTIPSPPPPASERPPPSSERLPTHSVPPSSFFDPPSLRPRQQTLASELHETVLPAMRMIAIDTHPPPPVEDNAPAEDDPIQSPVVHPPSQIPPAPGTHAGGEAGWTPAPYEVSFALSAGPIATSVLKASSLKTEEFTEEPVEEDVVISPREPAFVSRHGGSVLPAPQQPPRPGSSKPPQQATSASPRSFSVYVPPAPAVPSALKGEASSVLSLPSSPVGISSISVLSPEEEESKQTSLPSHSEPATKPSLSFSSPSELQTAPLHEPTDSVAIARDDQEPISLVDLTPDSSDIEVDIRDSSPEGQPVATREEEDIDISLEDSVDSPSTPEHASAKLGEKAKDQSPEEVLSARQRVLSEASTEPPMPAKPDANSGGDQKGSSPPGPLATRSSASAVTVASESSIEIAKIPAAGASQAPLEPSTSTPTDTVKIPASTLAAPQSVAAKKRQRPWWEELFDDDFLRSMIRLTKPQAAAEVNFIEERLGLAQGALILDLACGCGRHAVELTQRGYQVVGYDLSLAMLARAADEAEAAKQRINFLQGDMREMSFESMFDGVYCWGTSFGYFEEEKNLSVLQRVWRSLRPGGVFLLDVINRDFITPRQPNLVWFEGDGCICMDETQLDFITSRLKVKRTLMLEDGRTREIDYSVRLYGLHELGKLLHTVGFRVLEVSGHAATPGVFFGCDSPRCIVVAERD